MYGQNVRKNSVRAEDLETFRLLQIEKINKEIEELNNKKKIYQKHIKKIK